MTSRHGSCSARSKAATITHPSATASSSGSHEQEFPILPNPEDPDCGNLYRNLRFPEEIYKHIGHYQEQKMEAGE